MQLMIAPSRYANTFEQLQQSGKRAFIPFTVLGYPNRDASFESIKQLIDAGATALELGFAFSDPMADGPIIQQASQDVLANGFNVDDALQLIKDIRTYAPEIPIGLLVYYNMILARGVDTFFADIAAAGVDGVLIADLSVENNHEVLPATRQHHVQLIQMVSPLTTNERLKKITETAGGFIYVVSRLGITGVEERFDHQLTALLARLKAQTSLPLCVGFGISKPEHAAKMIQAGADGIIIGSRVIQLIQQHESIQQFVSEMLVACQ